MRIEAVWINGPPLYLVESSDTLRSQFAQPLDGPTELKAGVTTDSIIPADACKTPDPESLAHHVLTGWNDGVVKPGDIQELYPNVWVAGAAFGSGSSREHAPVAMLNAGCVLVVAKSFAPIFRRNATALGLYTSTNFDLLDRIKNGDPIPLDDLVDEHDALSREILRRGGLLPYLQARANGEVTEPSITTSERPMTIAEKWLAQGLDVHFVKPGDEGFVHPDQAYSYEYTLPLAEALLAKSFGKDGICVNDSTQLTLFNDHLSLDDDPRSASLEQITRDFAEQHNIRLFDTHGSTRPTTQGNIGICHVVMMDRVKPGVNVGTDSHTPMIAPLGGYVFGIGATDFAGIIQTGEVLVTVPKSVRVRLVGNLMPYVSARDLMLHLAALDASQKKLIGNVIEFDGPGLSGMTVLDLAVMANMSAEARALTAVFPPLPAVAEYLVKTERADSIEDALDLFPTPDKDAIYTDEIEIDLSQIEPTVALPSQPERGVPLGQVPGIRYNRVVIGACVGGGVEDIRIAAYILQGHHIAEGTQLVVHPHSIAAYQYARRQGWLQWIEDAGGIVVADIGCGACIGAGTGTLEKGDVAMTTDSRNHPGRMGDPDAQVYLASSVVSAVTAITGRTPTMNEILSHAQSVPWDEKASLFTI